MNDEMDFEVDDVEPWEDDAYETSYPEDDEPFDDMDGDHDSAMTSVGWGNDEDYGYYENDGDWYENDGDW